LFRGLPRTQKAHSKAWQFSLLYLIPMITD
jgi:hypothetical protein